MVQLCKTYGRSVLEQITVVWQGGITQERRVNLDRTHTSFDKIILNRKYKDYDHALVEFNLTSFDIKKTKLSLTFSTKWTSNKSMAHISSLKMEEIFFSKEKKRITWYIFNILREKIPPAEGFGLQQRTCFARGS